MDRGRGTLRGELAYRPFDTQGTAQRGQQGRRGLRPEPTPGGSFLGSWGVGSPQKTCLGILASPAPTGVWDTEEAQNNLVAVCCP